MIRLVWTKPNSRWKNAKQLMWHLANADMKRLENLQTGEKNNDAWVSEIHIWRIRNDQMSVATVKTGWRKRIVASKSYKSNSSSSSISIVVHPLICVNEESASAIDRFINLHSNMCVCVCYCGAITKAPHKINQHTQKQPITIADAIYNLYLC